MFETLKKLVGYNSVAENVATESAQLAAVNLNVGADGWCDVAIEGETPWVNHLGRVVGVQKITLDDMQHLEKAVNEATPDFGGVPVWEGHPKDAPALAWIKAARITAQNVLQVLPEWSEAGQNLLANKAYKWFSGAWNGLKDEQGRFRPRVFMHVGMTNRPNITGLGAVCSEGQGGWLDEFLGRMRTMLDGATTEEEALEILRKKWSVLYRAQSQVEYMQSLVRGIGHELGMTDDYAIPAEGGDIAGDKLLKAVEAASAAANRTAAAEQELSALNGRFSEFVVDQAINRRTVAVDLRPRALQIAAQNREEAIDLWFNGPAGATGPRQPPTSPLQSVNVSGGLPQAVTARVPSKEEIEQAVNSYQEEHPGTGYPAAFNAVYDGLTNQ